jgi:DNA topoisomerase-2
MAVSKQGISTFVNGQLRDWGIYNNQRNIPHLVDGLNLSQRKAVAAAMHIAATDKCKVSSLASCATERFDYHHGDSILDTVVRLAQDYPGSNNIPLLVPLGQFGSALNREYAAPRYIYTKLQPYFFDYFKKEDFGAVEPQRNEDAEIEPKYYVPLLPMVLVNGADGVGTGYRSFILPHCPAQVKSAVKAIVQNQPTPLLVPWLKGWKGNISKDASTNQVTLVGCLSVINKTTIHITELPPAYTMEKYKEHLMGMLEKDLIKDYENRSKNGNWFFEVTCKRELTDNNTQAKLEQLFGLVQRETETVVCWGVDGKIKHFANTNELLVAWVQARLALAAKSLVHQQQLVQQKLRSLLHRSAFIRWWIDNHTTLKDLGKGELTRAIQDEFPALRDDDIPALLNIRIYNLTKDEVLRLDQQIEAEQAEHTRLSAKSGEQWFLDMLE